MLRAMLNIDGEALFMGTDVARRLGYKNPQKALRDHVDEEDKLTERIVLSGQRRELIFINESGLYSLVLSSKLPSAKVFKHWVTSEVLPQIRQTGGYIPTRNARTGETLTEGEVMAVANSIMQRTISRYNLPADDCLTTSDIAKGLGMTAKELNSVLVKKGVQFWNGSRYRLKGEFEHLGYASDRLFHYFALDGEKKERTYLVWTPTGRDFIEEILNHSTLNIKH